MIRSTTPTIQCFLDNEQVLQQSIDDIYVTISQGPTRLTKTKEDVSIENNVVTIELSQKNTLLFKPGPARIQIKGKTKDGLVWATSIEDIDVTEILYRQVI